MNISEEIEYSVERSRTFWYGDFGEGMLVTETCPWVWRVGE